MPYHSPIFRSAFDSFYSNVHVKGIKGIFIFMFFKSNTNHMKSFRNYYLRLWMFMSEIILLINSLCASVEMGLFSWRESKW